APTLSLSQLVYGFWRADEWGMNTDQIHAHLEYCMELGLSSFDHADIYGGYTCESLMGPVLKRHPHLRERIEIVTKCGIKLITPNRPTHTVKHYDTSYDHITWSAENSLKELATDRIDLLLIHRPDPFINPSEVAKAFSDLKAAGKVLHFGVSNFTVQEFKTLASYLDFPLVTNQLEISVSCLDSFDDGNISFSQERRIKPMAWSPLGGGEIFKAESEKAVRIRDKVTEISQQVDASSIDQVMLRWLLEHPVGILPVLGTSKRERIAAAAQSCDMALTREQWFEIYIASRGQEVP
ncbi:MAG: aldo/keto reductase, partial [Bacteroidota bacterium]